jgi:type III restriction enzyme
VLEEMNQVICYTKNQNLGFAIPYTIDGEENTAPPTSWYECTKG